MKKQIIISILICITVSPLMGQSEFSETLNPELQQEEQYEKNIDQNTYGESDPSNAIGVATADDDKYVFRAYYKFDVSKVTNANNVQINEVRVFFDTGNNGDYNFKLTGPASINDASENESNWKAIGNADDKETGIIYGSGEIASEGLKDYLSSQISSDYLIIGALCEDEETVGSMSSLDLSLEIDYTYEAYTITVQNDFGGNHYGNIGVGVDEDPIKRTSPYDAYVNNDVTLNLQAYDHQNIDGYEWVFNDGEGQENESRWKIENNNTRISISKNQSTSYNVDNDQNSTIYNEQKRFYEIDIQDHNDWGVQSAQDVGNVVEQNDITIEPPETKQNNGYTLQFAGWENYPLESRTLTVTPDDNKTYKALYKGSRITDTRGSNRNINQQKIMRTSNGWQHQVYQSMGHVYYEVQPSGGDWQFAESSDQTLHLDSGGGKAPSIAKVNDFMNGSLQYEDYVTLAWQEGDKVKVQLFHYYGYQDNYTWQYSKRFDTGESGSYDVEPVIAWSGLNQFMVLWHTDNGLKYRICSVQPSNNTGQEIQEEFAGTLDGTDSYSEGAVVASDKNSSGDYAEYKIGWIQSSGGYENEVKLKQLWASTSYGDHTTGATETVSYSRHKRNKSLSLINVKDGSLYYEDTYRIGWVANTSDDGDPTDTEVFIYNQSDGVYSFIDYYGRSMTLGNAINKDFFYIAYNQNHPDPYTDLRTLYVKSSSLNSKNVLDNPDQWIQLYNAPDGSDMRINVFKEGSTNLFEQTQPLASMSKKRSTGDTMRHALDRGFMVSNDENVQLHVDLERPGLNGQPLSFISSEIDADRRAMLDTTGKPPYIDPEGLYSAEHAEKYLKTEWFEIGPEDRLSFKPSFSFEDLETVSGMLSSLGSAKLKLELVDASGKKLRTLTTIPLIRSELEKGTQSKRHTITDIVSGETKVRLQMRIETDGEADKLDYFIYNDYTVQDNEADQQQDGSYWKGQVVEEYKLTNHPNPFNPATRIKFNMPEAGHVKLEVYNIMGRHIKTLVDERKDPGQHSVRFNANNLASGTYIYRIHVNDFTEAGRMNLVK